MDDLQIPQQLPTATHEVIVLLEAVHMAIENLNTNPRSHELLSYHRVTDPNAIRDRVQCASIVIATQAPINAKSLGQAPYLKCVITPTTGTNHVDLVECKARGIRVVNTPGGTADAVAEHALGLYFAARRKIITIHQTVADRDENGENLWKREVSAAYKMRTADGYPPNSLSQEVAGIFGHGYVGKRLEVLCRALGMTVIISERKKTPQAALRQSNPGVHRMPFGEVLKSATVLFITCLRNDDTFNMIDEPEFALIRPDAVIICVSRGGIVNEKALVKSLREDRISGAGMDVFAVEPASSAEDSAVLGDDAKGLNLTFSPHLGYFSVQTVVNMQVRVKEHIHNWVTGQDMEFVA